MIRRSCSKMLSLYSCVIPKTTLALRCVYSKGVLVGPTWTSIPCTGMANNLAT